MRPSPRRRPARRSLVPLDAAAGFADGGGCAAASAAVVVRGDRARPRASAISPLSEDLRSRWSGRWHDAEWKPRHRPEGTRGGVGTVAGAPSNERTEWSGNKENVLREREAQGQQARVPQY